MDIELKLPEKIPDIKPEPLKALELAKENNPIYLANRQQLLEAGRDVEKSKKESKFNSDLTASYGLNQTSETFSGGYKNPRDQEKIMLTFTIPILDWGIAKGNYKLAMRRQEATRLMLEQAEIDFKQNVIHTVDEFIIQKNLVTRAAKADTIAQKAYEITKKRFLIEKADLTKLGAAQQARISAKNAYLEALEKYWNYYYTIRELTLFDFERQVSLSADFDILLGITD